MLLSPNIAVSRRTDSASCPSVVLQDLTVLAYAQGFTLWLYRHSGGFSECMRPSFFYDARDMLKQGDVVMIRAADGSGMRTIEKPLGRLRLGAML